VAAVLAVLSNTCLLHFSPAELLHVCCIVDSAAGTHVTVNGSAGSSQILVWGKDRPHLFSHLTAALAGANIKILTAHAYAMRDGRVLDEFHVTDERNRLLVDSDQIERLRRRLQKVLDGNLPPAIKRSSKPDVLMQALPVRVRRFDAAAKRITAVEVVAADRKALLADLATAIANLGIDLRGANITTFGEKAVDVFFMTNSDGQKLNENQTQEVIEQLHAAAQLQPQATSPSGEGEYNTAVDHRKKVEELQQV